MNIRFAEESDLAALTALINRAFKVEAFFIVRDRLTPEEAREYFEKGRFLLADENGQLAGVVYVELRGDRSYLGLLSVDPDLQKSGLGRRLTFAAGSASILAGLTKLDIQNGQLELVRREGGYRVVAISADSVEAQITVPGGQDPAAERGESRGDLAKLHRHRLAVRDPGEVQQPAGDVHPEQAVVVRTPVGTLAKHRGYVADRLGVDERTQFRKRRLGRLAHLPQALGDDHPKLGRRIVEQGGERRHGRGSSLAVTANH